MTRTHSPGRTGPRHDVRTRIQQVALDLFTEEGYDRASLRGIAERVGVTKAALYYHFPAKEDLADSLLEERIDTLDALIGWAERQPDPDRMRPELLRRYEDSLHGPGGEARIARFLRRNPLVLDLLPAGRRLRDRFDRILALLAGPDRSPAAHLRRILALLCLHLDDLLPSGPARDGPTCRAAALTVALETIRPRG